MKQTKTQQYSVSNEFEISFEPLSKFTLVDNFTDGKNLMVAQVKSIETKSGYYNEVKEKVWSKVINKNQLPDILEKPETVFENSGKYALPHPICLLRKDFMAYFEEWGFMNNLRNVLRLPQKDVYEFHLDNIFENATNANVSFLEYAPIQLGKNGWKDNKGVLHSEPFVFDYTQAHIENKTYHLDEFVEHLIKRDDVGFIIKDNLNYKLLKGPLDESEKGINSIIGLGKK